jgi:D-alanyl-D-alanine carboxypeptidase
VKTRLQNYVRNGLTRVALLCLLALMPSLALSAPYAAFVMDARTGEVLHSRNADTRLHPASLTKMMTLYITFEAIKNGDLSLDTVVKISKHAASEPPSKLGLVAGQRIKIRYLIRAAAVKSANDAATALGEAVAGSEAAFARRMNRTAKALGMMRTTFKNANGLTETGHLSTARDMSLLGRHMIYDYPQYYNLFSRRTAHAGVRTVNNTNTRLLNAYRGADGIKTGYTRAAGFNLVSSALRGNERIIATVFGGRSTATRNARIAELLDLGFRRAPTRAALRKPRLPNYSAPPPTAPGAAGKTIRLVTAVKKSIRPPHRPNTTSAPSETVLVAMKTDIESTVGAVRENTPETAAIPAAPRPAPPETTPQTTPQTTVASTTRPETAPQLPPPPRPETMVLASITPDITPDPPVVQAPPVVVTRISGGTERIWGVNVGRYSTRHEAERFLLKTALKEMTTLDGSLRKIAPRSTGYDANFVGMSKATAEMACRRLSARHIPCTPIRP